MSFRRIALAAAAPVLVVAASVAGLAGGGAQAATPPPPAGPLVTVTAAPVSGSGPVDGSANGLANGSSRRGPARVSNIVTSTTNGRAVFSPRAVAGPPSPSGCSAAKHTVTVNNHTAVAQQLLEGTQRVGQPMAPGNGLYLCAPSPGTYVLTLASNSHTTLTVTAT